jgi:DNA-directed RNA polymerase specialized sigma24 family protein
MVKTGQETLMRDTEAVIKSIYSHSPELDDLLSEARLAVLSVLDDGVEEPLRQTYCFRRAKCRCIDYLRKQERCDPVKHAQRLAAAGVGLATPRLREKTLAVQARVPIRLKAKLYTTAMSHNWSISKTLRAALEQGLETLDG